MIKRVAMWKLKDPERADEFIALLNQLDGIATGLSSMEAYKNISNSVSAYDVLFCGLFKTEEDLRAFERDSFHVDIAQQVNQMRITRSVVDCIVSDQTLLVD